VNEHTSIGLVQTLNKNGITDAFALKGGTQAWLAAGFPMEGSMPRK
jgi:rhodanese-related sulfurtransferase